MSAAILLADTITKIGEAHRGQVVVSGSHGGLYAGTCASRGGVRAVILNDAGIGKDEAGIGSLAALDAVGLATAAADGRTCRIADAADMMAAGIVSHVNRAAASLGCRPGQTVRDCAELMRAAPLPTGVAPPVQEARFVILERGGEPIVIGIDSASLFRPEDAGRIVVTASHGGLIGGKPDTSVPDGVFAATFHDAGGGKDGSGYSRLADLDGRGVAAATVSSASARIGDARSCYGEGLVSRLNGTAERLGGRTGMKLRELVELLAAAAGARSS